MNFAKIFEKHLTLFFEEDGLSSNYQYLNSLPKKTITCRLKIKDDLVLAGLPFLFETFNYLEAGVIDYDQYLEFEGQSFKKSEQKDIQFQLPFHIALSGERLALNLVQRASSIATNVHRFTSQVENIKVLDTRKTTPGLRFLEKYAVNIGGGYNHRFSQTDIWMIKDNHKKIFGGVKPAVEHFKKIHSFYQPIILEIHSLSELTEGIEVGVKHFLLDNFSPESIQEAVNMKKPGTTYEVSGGITENNISSYNIEGVDAISSGSLIYNAHQVDLSLKMEL